MDPPAARNRPGRFHRSARCSEAHGGAASRDRTLPAAVCRPYGGQVGASGRSPGGLPAIEMPTSRWRRGQPRASRRLGSPRQIVVGLLRPVRNQLAWLRRRVVSYVIPFSERRSCHGQSVSQEECRLQALPLRTIHLLATSSFGSAEQPAMARSASVPLWPWVPDPVSPDCGPRASPQPMRFAASDSQQGCATGMLALQGGLRRDSPGGSLTGARGKPKRCHGVVTPGIHRQGQFTVRVSWPPAFPGASETRRPWPRRRAARRRPKSHARRLRRPATRRAP